MGNGGERVSASLANYWVTKGWEIAIVTLSQQSLDFYELHPAVKRIALELTEESANVLAELWQNIRRVIALRRVLRQIQPDIALGMGTITAFAQSLQFFPVIRCAADLYGSRDMSTSIRAGNKRYGN